MRCTFKHIADEHFRQLHPADHTTLLLIRFATAMGGEIIGHVARANEAYNAPNQGSAVHPGFSILSRSSDAIWILAVPNHLAESHAYKAEGGFLLAVLCLLIDEPAGNHSLPTYTRTDYQNTSRNIEFDRQASCWLFYVQYSRIDFKYSHDQCNRMFKIKTMNASNIAIRACRQACQCGSIRHWSTRLASPAFH